MLSECFNCNAIWCPGSEEWDAQTCSACGWHPGMPIDEDIDDEFEDDYGEWPDDDDEWEEEAANCTCGAYAVGKDGKWMIVSDCIC